MPFLQRLRGTSSTTLVKVGGKKDAAVSIVVIIVTSRQIPLSVHGGSYGSRHIERSLLRVMIHFEIYKINSLV